MKINENLIIDRNEPLESMAKKIYANGKDKGWWSKGDDVHIISNSLHSEVSELWNEYRMEEPRELYYDNDKPCGYGIELADLLMLVLYVIEELNFGFNYNKIDKDCFCCFVPLQEIIGDIHEYIVGVKEEININNYYSYLPDLVDIIFTFARQENIDLLKCVEIKHKYNLTRPKKHGKRF
jgi:hypothetical protein